MKKLPTPQEDFNWMLEHWWIFAILIFLSLSITVYAILEVPTEEELLSGNYKKRIAWKVIWGYLFCSRKKCELIEYNKIFYCKDCGMRFRP